MERVKQIGVEVGDTSPGENGRVVDDDEGAGRGEDGREGEAGEGEVEKLDEVEAVPI